MKGSLFAAALLLGLAEPARVERVVYEDEYGNYGEVDSARPSKGICSFRGAIKASLVCVAAVMAATRLGMLPSVYDRDVALAREAEAKAAAEAVVHDSGLFVSPDGITQIIKVDDKLIGIQVTELIPVTLEEESKESVEGQGRK